MSAADAPWSATATQLSQLFKSGACDPVRAIQACLARIEDTNPTLNAIVTLDADNALEAARASRERWRIKRQISVLDGVPLTVKDNLFVGGLRATWGSSLFADHVASRDDIPVARLRAAGAIVLGKTNTPEFSLAGFTDNKLFGSTGNPWAVDLSPGGSSGGAAASVMAGMAPLALVTDAGGSTRRPAAHVGCVGFKPSLGRVPRRHGFPQLAADLQTVGFLARSVPDARAVFDAIADSALEDARATSGLKIGTFCKIAGHPVEPDVEAAWRKACSTFAQAGHHIKEIEPPYVPDDMSDLLMALASVGIARVVVAHADWREKLTGPMAALAEKGTETSAVAYAQLLDRVAQARANIRDIFESFDLLLTPTAPVALWPRHEPYPKTIGGTEAAPRDSGIYTAFVNVAGLPAVSLPAGLDSNGHPLGIQLVGPMNAERFLLDVAEWWEGPEPWPRVAPFAAPVP